MRWEQVEGALVLELLLPVYLEPPQLLPVDCLDPLLQHLLLELRLLEPLEPLRQVDSVLAPLLLPPPEDLGLAPLLPHLLLVDLESKPQLHLVVCLDHLLLRLWADCLVRLLLPLVEDCLAHPLLQRLVPRLLEACLVRHRPLLPEDCLEPLPPHQPRYSELLQLRPLEDSEPSHQPQLVAFLVLQGQLADSSGLLLLVVDCLDLQVRFGDHVCFLC